MAMWRSKDCALPNDDKLLSRYAKLTAGQWARIKPVIMPFFRIASDQITQCRLTDEAVLVRRNSRKASDSARSRWLKDKESSDAVALPDECQTDAPTTTPTTTPIVSGGVEGASESVLPAVAIIQAFDQARIQHFGPELARPWPTATDKMTAQRWIDAGADLDLCRDVFAAGFARKASARDGPPDSLKFFEKSIANAIAERSRPMPEGAPNGTGNRNPPRAGGGSAHEAMFAGAAEVASRYLPDRGDR
jgi:hypothetical protein